MQGEGQGPEGPKQFVALTSALTARMGRSPHPAVGQEGAEKMRCGFLLPVAMVAGSSRPLLSISLLQQRRLQGGQKSALILLSV